MMEEKRITFWFLCRICAKEVGTAEYSPHFSDKDAVIICSECQTKFEYVGEPLTLDQLARIASLAHN